MPSKSSGALRPGTKGRREATFNEKQLMAAIGVDNLEALDRHLDGLLKPEGGGEAPASRLNSPPLESHVQAGPEDHRWWLMGAGVGIGVALSGVYLAVARRFHA